MAEPTKGKRYYSNTCGHRCWFHTGRSWEPKGYPYYGDGTRVYEFADICDHVETFTLEQFENYFEEVL